MSAGHELVLKPYRGLEFTVRVHANGDISGSLWQLDSHGCHVVNLAFALSHGAASMRGSGSRWRTRSDADDIWIGSTSFQLPAADVAKVAAFLEAHAPKSMGVPE